MGVYISFRNMKYKIRDYKEDDYPYIIKFISEELEESGEDLKKINVENIAKDHLDFSIDKIRIMEISKGDVIGWYRYSNWPRDEKNSTTAHLFDIAVVKKYRRKDYGKKLFLDLMKQLLKNKYKKLYSCTIEGNQNAYNFHLKMGFRLTKRIKSKIIWMRNIN